MGKKRKTCGTCGRVRKKDLGRGYCPVAASRIYVNKPADKCVFYSDKDKLSERDGDDFWEDDDVC